VKVETAFVQKAGNDVVRQGVLRAQHDGLIPPAAHARPESRTRSASWPRRRAASGLIVKRRAEALRLQGSIRSALHTDRQRRWWRVSPAAKNTEGHVGARLRGNHPLPDKLERAWQQRYTKPIRRVERASIEFTEIPRSPSCRRPEGRRASTREDRRGDAHRGVDNLWGQGALRRQGLLGVGQQTSIRCRSLEVKDGLGRSSSSCRPTQLRYRPAYNPCAWGRARPRR